MAVKIGGKKQAVSGGNGNVMKKGMKPARLVQVAHVGMQPNIDFNTKEEVLEDTFYFTFEFPNERVEYDGKDQPRWLSRGCKVSDYKESNFFKICTALNGGDYDPEEDDPFEMVGNAAMVTVGHTKTGKAKVTDVNTTVEGFPVPELENPTAAFTVHAPDINELFKLPEWLQKVATKNEDFKGSQLEALLEEGFDDEIPF